jgi:2,7-dihydroxy-5-methyl-1-naphthoate 7-O-methyltransferase
VRSTLVDLPGTVARAAGIIAGSADAAVASRITVAGQSFFDPLPAGADLYLLKSVLNDWPDKPTMAILSRCARSATRAHDSAPGGRGRGMPSS